MYRTRMVHRICIICAIYASSSVQPAYSQYTIPYDETVASILQSGNVANATARDSISTIPLPDTDLNVSQRVSAWMPSKDNPEEQQHIQPQSIEASSSDVSSFSIPTWIVSVANVTHTETDTLSLYTKQQINETLSKPLDVVNITQRLPSNGNLSEADVLALYDDGAIESSVPSMLPSDSPSLLPSDVPSMLPSSLPTISTVPSVLPSVRPTMMPSVPPSNVISESPSIFPTVSPSGLPSDLPSYGPTAYCHDVDNYRSPINNLSCQEHSGTNCMQWRYIGLNADQVQDLIDSCPESCGIECGSSERFDIRVSFQVLQATTFLGPDTALRMEKVGVEYLTGYITSRIGTSSDLYISDAELLSQQIVIANSMTQQPEEEKGNGNGNNNSSTRRLQSTKYSSRHVQERRQSVALLLGIAFRGISINMDTEKLEALFSEGVKSPGYTNSLQRSGDPELGNVVVSTTRTDEKDSLSNADNDSGPSPGGVAASILVTLTVVAVCIFFFVRHYRQSKGHGSWSVSKEAQDHSAFNSMPASPQNSPLNGAFSFESTNSVVAGFRNLVASFSPRSNDESNTTSSKSTDNGEQVVTEVAKEENKDVEPPPTDEDVKEEESVEEEHPYSHFIPPMLVMNHIDSGEWSRSNSDDTPAHIAKVKNVVPSRRVQAPTGLIAALNDRSRPFDPSPFSGFFQEHSISTLPPSDTSLKFGHDGSFEGRSKTLPCKLPSPINNEEDFLLELRRALSDSDVAKSTDSAIIEAAHSMVLQTPRQCSTFSDIDRPNAMLVHQDSVKVMVDGNATAEIDNTADLPSSVSFHSLPTQTQSNKKPPLNKLMLAFRKSPGKARRRVSPPSAGNTRPEYIENIPNTIDSGSSVAMSQLDSGFNLASSSILPPPTFAHTNHSRSNSKAGSNTGSDHGSSDGYIQHIFQAPRKGKLGLVIECSSITGPVVMEVKNYSPLLGQVIPGDCITSIDGTDTVGMSLPDVSKLLSGTSTSWRSSIIRIVVKRVLEYNDDMNPLEMSIGNWSIPNTGSSNSWWPNFRNNRRPSSSGFANEIYETPPSVDLDIENPFAIQSTCIED